jgi:hypothetical protein
MYKGLLLEPGSGAAETFVVMFVEPALFAVFDDPGKGTPPPTKAEAAP